LCHQASEEKREIDLREQLAKLFQAISKNMFLQNTVVVAVPKNALYFFATSIPTIRYSS